MVIAFISGVLRRDVLQSILNSTGWHLSPIKKDTESWAYVIVVLRGYLNGGYAGNTTRWSRNGIRKKRASFVDLEEDRLPSTNFHSSLKPHTTQWASMGTSLFDSGGSRTTTPK